MKGGGIDHRHHKIAKYEITVDHENYTVNFMKFKDGPVTDYYLVVPEGYPKIPSWDEFPHKKKQLGNNLKEATRIIEKEMHGHIVPEDENMHGGRKRKTRKTKKTRLTKRRRLT